MASSAVPPVSRGASDRGLIYRGAALAAAPGAVWGRVRPPELARAAEGPSAADARYGRYAWRSGRARMASLHRRIRPHNRGVAAEPINKPRRQLAGTGCQPV